MTTFIVPIGQAPALNMQIGSSVKDLAQGAQTSAKRAHTNAVERITVKFNEDMAAYERKLPSLLEKKLIAERDIGDANFKSTIALIVSIASVIATVGLAITAMAVRSTPIGFAAFAFGLLFIPEMIALTHFSSIVARLQTDIDAPTSLKPELQLPTYKPEKDLELKETRTKILHELAQKRVLNKIADSGLSKEELVSFALLDGLAPKEEGRRAAFYAKTVQLIDVCAENQKKHAKAIEKVKKRFEEQKSKLIEPSYRYHRSRLLDNLIDTGNQINKAWKEEAIERIDAQYKEAKNQVEQQFTLFL